MVATGGAGREDTAGKLNELGITSGTPAFEIHPGMKWDENAVCEGVRGGEGRSKRRQSLSNELWIFACSTPLGKAIGTCLPFAAALAEARLLESNSPPVVIRTRFSRGVTLWVLNTHRSATARPWGGAFLTTAHVDCDDEQKALLVLIVVRELTGT